MKKNPWLCIGSLLILLFWSNNSLAQNNLAAGDIAIVSYQNSTDPGNPTILDRFSFVVLKSDGLAGGTVLYFTDNGWSIDDGNFTPFLEGTIKWTAPPGGIAFGAEVYFINNQGNPGTFWQVFNNENGTGPLGTVSTENGNLLLSISGDQILAYQTGPPAGTAGTYNNSTRRFITAIHANVETITTYAAWDGNSPFNGTQSSLPPGLTNGVNAFLLSQATLPSTSPLAEVDNGKYNCTGAGGCNPADIRTAICDNINWALNNNPFGVGATSGQCTYSIFPFSLPIIGITVTKTVNTGNNPFYTTVCELIANIVPSGAQGVAGSVTSQVWVESAVPTFGNQPFVARHYEITPAAAPGIVSARITLYFSQTEFDAFNAAPGSIRDLPAHPFDDMGKANLRVGKYAGTSNNGSGLPGSYTGNVTVIDPVDADIVWNTPNSRWEVSFETTGFSGFIIQTSTVALPVNLISFSAQSVDNNIHLQWKTARETDHDYFDLERSTNGISYTAVARITGNNGNTIQNYSWTDKGAMQLTASKIYYRLKMVSTTGKTEYSYILMVPIAKSTVPSIEITPNPFTDQLNIRLYMPAKARIALRLTDITGKTLKREYIDAPKGATMHSMTDIHTLAKGIYFLVAEYNGQLFSYKVVK